MQLFLIKHNYPFMPRIGGSLQTYASKGGTQRHAEEYTELFFAQMDRVAPSLLWQRILCHRNASRHGSDGSTESRYG